jgi:hypothetical protein
VFFYNYRNVARGVLVSTWVVVGNHKLLLTAAVSPAP